MSLQRAESRGASLLSAADEGPTGNHRRRFMKLSGGVNGLSVPPPFACNHDNKTESGMAVHSHCRGVEKGGYMCEEYMGLCSGLENKLISLT